MALADPIVFAYDGANINLNRLGNASIQGDVYYGEATDLKLTLTVKHTIPARGADGESHLVRLDVEHSASGVYTRTASAWMVIRTTDAPQDTESSEDAAEALVDFLSDANITKIVGRQS